MVKERIYMQAYDPVHSTSYGQNKKVEQQKVYKMFFLLFLILMIRQWVFHTLSVKRKSMQSTG